MFKKSEDQEWTRFRGTPSREREEVPQVDGVDHLGQPAPAQAQVGAAAAAAGPSFRPSSGDVNVTVPSRSPRTIPAPDSHDVETLVGQHTVFEGTLKSEGAVRILGTVQGEIESKGTIIVEDRAQVTAKVTASNVNVAGKVDGQIYCQGRVEIRSTGRVVGEVHAATLIVQEGAYFDGNSKMSANGNEAEVGSSR